MTMDLDQALQTFIAEARELLEGMERALLEVEQAQAKDELVNAIFRAAHTIKGSAGLFGLEPVVKFTHVVESVLDRVRDGTLGIDGDLVGLLLSCADHLGALVERIARGADGSDAETQANARPLVEALRRYLGAPAEAAAVSATASAAPAVVPGSAAADLAAADHWHISLRFGRDSFRNGMDPMSFITYLGTLGRIAAIVTLPDAIPAADEMDPESCYLGFEIAFESTADKAAIEGVFEFVREDCAIRILPPKSRVADYVALIEGLPEEPARLGEILMRCGSLTQQELDAALDAQSGVEAQAPIGQILVEQRAVQPAVVEAAVAKQQRAKDAKSQESRSIRVDADKLDHLINLVGELIIAGASANLIARRAKLGELQECTSRLSTLVEEVRDSALQLRMVKIGGTFSRFQRVVRDVARELGKDIGLVVSGEDTELDKTVVENIGDPLTHLVRNAMDHGIERAEDRIARGKPAQGTVRLNAYHDSGSIVIEVSDDGGGLNRTRILDKAIERGLVEAGKPLSDREIYRLIFEPGFSTAEQITNLSGRGVGMDVVKRNITALRGTVDIDSTEGVGTTVTVRLPLTLAIIDGFMVGVGRSTFVVPLDVIEECVEFDAAPGRDYCDLRGEVLPFIRVRELFEIEGAAGRRESIVVVRHAGQKVGLVVDTLLGEFQTVIKPLGRLFSHVRCISGSTILGSGGVALIVDVPAVVNQILSAETARGGESRDEASRAQPVPAL
jgi:two-component system chemotaxis sensor kinase CheA